MKRLPLAMAIMASLTATSAMAFSSIPQPVEHKKSVGSMGANGWASAEESVTGGAGATADRIYTVTNRKQLIEALYGSQDANINADPSNEKKVIYIKGKIDLSANQKGNKSMTAEDFMAQCEQYGYNDYDTFYQAYRSEFNPHTWNKQSLASNGRPPAVSGPLEDARDCYQKAQAAYTVLRVGSNTSILGLGNNAELSFGTLLLGKNGEEPVSNIVIRNIEFKDAFDFFPSWSPTDSFKIDKNEFGVGNCSDAYVSDEVNPAACESIEGGRWNSEYDLISVDNAHRVWIDHNTFSDGKRTDDKYPPVFAAPYNAKEQKVQHHDGLVDVTNGATQVTMSYNHFKNHDKTNLLGGSDTTNAERSYGPGSIDVTFHHNYWQDTGQRMPRVRFGRVHVYNNFFQLDASSDPAPTYRMGDAIILGTASKIVAENNSFEIKGEDFAKKIIGFSSSQSNRTKCENTQRYEVGACATYFYAQGNLVNGEDMDLNEIAQTRATSSSSNSPLTILSPNSDSEFWLPRYSYDYQLKPAQQVKNEVVRHAGSGKLKFNPHHAK